LPALLYNDREIPQDRFPCLGDSKANPLDCGSTYLADFTELRRRKIIKTGFHILMAIFGPVFAMLLCFAVDVAELRAAESSVASPDKPVEYIIYQYPAVTLLIQIDAVETEFEAKVYGPERTLIKHSRLPARRVGPVFQLIEPVSSARQLIVEIIPAYPTDRSRIKMELQQLREDARTDALQAEAFRLMSRAVDATPANDSTTWAGKIYTFKRAAQVFEALGWEELRLWCEYYAAHLVFFKLGDALSALEMAQAVQKLARKAGFNTIEMVAMQLEGMTLTNAVELRTETSDGEKYLGIHQVLRDTAALADRLGFQSERALAYFNDGIAWEQQEDLEQALEQYRLALDISVSAGDQELANRIRNQAAFAYESRGSVAGAIEMLEQVGDELAESDAALELAESLFEKGRILNESFRFSESVAALSEAHDLLVSAGYASRLAQTGLALGGAYFGLGRMDEAAAILTESITNAPVAELSGEVEAGLGMLAAVQRYRGDWPAMEKAREKQAEMTGGREAQSRLSYEQAMDELAKPDGRSSAAIQLLARSQAQAANAGDTVLPNRAQLQLCALSSDSATTSYGCSRTELDRAVHSVEQSGALAEIIEARLARARVLRKNGDERLAMSEMGQLIDEIRFFRSALPGVLGGWYWGNRYSVFNLYLDLALQSSGANVAAFADGRDVLLVLERLKRIASEDSKERPRTENEGEQDQYDHIRSLLAALRKTDQPAEQGRIARAIDKAVAESYKEFASDSPVIETGAVEEFLKRLPPDSMFLTYCFSGNEVYALIAGDSAIRIRKLSRGSELVSRLDRLRTDLGSPESLNWTEGDLSARLETLGALMLGPLEPLLKSTVYLMPLGLLRGFPFDLLRLDGQYLAERYRVINLMSLSPEAKLAVQAETSDMELFFLAGDPELSRDVFSYEQKRSAEISAITDLFVGPALHIVQGPALKKDEFVDERFGRADIVHLSIPTLVDLEDAQLSKMTLSSSGESSNGGLRPGDLPTTMNASLAVLSLTRFQGQESAGYGNHLDFVSDLLDAGVNAVVSSLWPLDDESRARFMAAFYRSLAADPDVALALYRAKREWFQQQKSSNAAIWAGFQLFVR
jgi:CHAT domain-containing protein